jgi:hypothetical protein
MRIGALWRKSLQDFALTNPDRRRPRPQRPSRSNRPNGISHQPECRRGRRRSGLNIELQLHCLPERRGAPLALQLAQAF